MTAAADAKKVVDAARERGLPAPESCLPPVVLTDRLAPFYDAFWELSSTRQIHMGGVGPIPWDVLDAYAARHGFTEDVDHYDDLTFIVRSMDSEYLAIQSSDLKRAQAKAEAEAKARGRGRGRGRR